MAEHVQTTYRRNVNPFVAGQVATARTCQFDSGVFQVADDTVEYKRVLPFGYAVGLVDGTNDRSNSAGRFALRGNACARDYTTSGSGTSTVLTNFGGIAVRNVALPGAGTNVAGVASDAENLLRVVDAYNENDIVSIGSEGDFVVVCAADVRARNPVFVDISTNDEYGQFYGSSSATGRASVEGAIFMTDSTDVTPYSGGASQKLAIVRIRLQPR